MHQPMKRFRHQLRLPDILKDVLRKTKYPPLISRSVSLTKSIWSTEPSFPTETTEKLWEGLTQTKAQSCRLLALDFIRQMQVGQRIRIIG